MTKAILAVAACVTLMWTSTVLAAPTAQQKCDSARITAWKKYVSCVDGVLAKDAKLGYLSFNEFAAFAKCRHAYFKKWTAFQTNASLATSTCIGTRFTDNGDDTVTDHLNALVWEKKENIDGTPNPADPHDPDNNFYSWSTGLGTNKEDGTAFTSFLADAGTGLNTVGFAGANGWRLPTLAELQTIVLDFTCAGATCSCGSNPCIDGTFGPTRSLGHWSASTYVPGPGLAWLVDFANGLVFPDFKTNIADYFVRAVRGGL